MDLNTSLEVTPDLIAAVCDLDDDVYRNRWITYVYGEMSTRLAEHTGGDNPDANWFTLARWSSFTVGENMRLDKVNGAFVDFVDRHPPLRLLRSQLTKLQLDMRTLSDAAGPRTLALGNRYVFHEICWALVSYLEWYESTTRRPPVKAFETFRDGIDAFTLPTKSQDIFPECDINLLRDGIEAYYRAAGTRNRDQKSRYVLRGNVLLAAYEQWRLQPTVEIALDPVARHLVKFHNTNVHCKNPEPTATVRRRGTPWALRHRDPLVEWLSQRYAEFVTTNILGLETQTNATPAAPPAPSKAVSKTAKVTVKAAPVPAPAPSANTITTKTLTFGTGVPAPPPGQDLYPPALDDPHDPTTLIVQVFDRSNGTPEGTSVRNWTSYSQRMNFIVNLFRSRQTDGSLFTDTPPGEERLLNLNLTEDHLNGLRDQGDDAARDALLGTRSINTSDPRALVSDLITKKVNLSSKVHLGSPALPAWADKSTLLEGQRFLCTHGLEIANALFFASLPYSYTASNGSHVLAHTAELMTGDTARRLAETGVLIVDLMTQDPRGALAEGTQAFESVHGIRLFHAAVRLLIERRPETWDTKLGVPINQEDLLGTLIVFSIVALDAIAALGVDITSEQGMKQRDAYVHFWLVVGHLLGIDYGALRDASLAPTEVPLTYGELSMLSTSIFRRQAKASIDGQILMASLLETTSNGLPWFLKGYPAAATRGLIGMERADMLGVPPAGPGRVPFEIVKVGSRLLSPLSRYGGLAMLARTSTKYLYRDWIAANGGLDPPWRQRAIKNWRLGRRFSLWP